MTEKYQGLVGVNDHFHVADLMMEDIGKLPWIAEVIGSVFNIALETFKHRKLLARLKLLIEE